MEEFKTVRRSWKIETEALQRQSLREPSRIRRVDRCRRNLNHHWLNLIESTFLWYIREDAYTAAEKISRNGKVSSRINCPRRSGPPVQYDFQAYARSLSPITPVLSYLANNSSSSQRRNREKKRKRERKRKRESELEDGQTTTRVDGCSFGQVRGGRPREIYPADKNVC